EIYGRFPELAKKVDEEITVVKDRVKDSFRALSAKVDRMIDEKRLAEAKALLERARERYIGTEVAAQVAMKSQVISLVSRGRKSDRGQAERLVKAKEKLYLSAAEAERHARRREYDKAIGVYRDILAEASDAEVQEEFSRRVEELTAIRDLFTEFIAAAGGSLKGQDWDLGNGAVVRIDGADRERVRFSIASSAGSTSKLWKAFRPEELTHLLSMVATSGEGRFTLALFAFRSGLDDRGEQLLVEAATRDAGLQPRIDALLGRVRGEPVPSGGYVVYKQRWFSRVERDRAIEDDKIDGLVKIILTKGLTEAAGAVGKLGTMKRGRKALVDALYEKREILKKNMAKDLRFDNQVLVRLKRQLDDARAEALDFIEDVVRFPDKKKMEAEGRMGEYWKILKEEVDTRVKAVRTIWENPYAAVIQMNPAARNIEKELRKVNEWLAREDKKFDPKKADEVDTGYIASLARAKLNIKTFAPEKKEQKLIAFNLAVMEWNSKNKEATATERRQVRITNEYRWMLGRRVVKIEDMLVKAARGHSAYMSATGTFAHVIPDEPEGATPRERCKFHGYTAGSTSENISYNHTSPQATFNAWYRSSGHHRNMINRNWAVLGAGLDGPHWTQNFGSTDSTKGKPGSPGGGGWPGTAWRGGRAKKKKK
ncbi:MAG: CAP domain-containing protein, partial [Planctomycetota bacterium]